MQEIVGVVGNVREQALHQPARPAIYIPYAQHPADWAYLVVRTTGDPHGIVPSLRRVVAALDRRTWDVVVSDYSMPSFNGLAALEVLDGRVGADLAADDFEEGDATGEGVGHGLVDEEGEGFFVEDAAGDGVVVGGAVAAAVG